MECGFIRTGGVILTWPTSTLRSIFFWSAGWEEPCASLDQLYMIGRAVTITSVTITMLVLGVFLNRRYGATAAALGMVLSVGVRPLFQAGLMCRPDALAELLGLTGFFLVGCRSAALAFAGGLSLWLAAATKQTALVYLLAGVMGLFLQARRVRALAVLAGVTAPLLMTVLAVQYFIEPNFAPCMLGEARTAADFASWWQTIRGVSLADPEFFALSAAAFWIWCRGRRKEPSLAALAALLWVSSVITAAKRGSGDNYFLGVRSIAALGAAALWDQVRATGLRPRAWHVVASAATALGMVLSVYDAGAFLSLAVMSKRLRASPQGKAIDKLYEQIYAPCGEPRAALLDRPRTHRYPPGRSHALCRPIPLQAHGRDGPDQPGPSPRVHRFTEIFCFDLRSRPLLAHLCRSRFQPALGTDGASPASL